jgi:hypothetical protein
MKPTNFNKIVPASNLSTDTECADAGLSTFRHALHESAAIFT